MPRKLDVDWLTIEQACAAGLNFAEAEIKFGVKQDSIRKRAKRYKWVLPKHVALAVRVKNEIAVQKAAENWLEKGEQHRERAFEVASESVRRFKAKAPKSFRELEAADKIARRAAGLDTSEVHVQTLINLNERMDSFENEQPVEASEIEQPQTGPVIECDATVLPASSDSTSDHQTSATSTLPDTHIPERCSPPAEEVEPPASTASPIAQSSEA